MRYAIRSLLRQPMFSLSAIATLAVGIGLNIALFGIFNAMLFRPLPVHEPGRLVAILSASTKPDGPRGHLTYPDFEALRARRDVLVDAFGFTKVPLGLSVSARAIRADGQIVTANMFEVLGVRPAHGRMFAASDEREPVAVLSYDLWQQMFGGDPQAVGQTIVINGRHCTVVGIAPRGFKGPDRFEPAELWIPLGLHETAFPGESNMLSAQNWWLTGIGRLANGVSVAAAQSSLGAVGQALARSQPDSHDGFMLRVTAYRGADDHSRGEVMPIAALVLAVTVCVLLIACANVAALLLSRTASRQREIGIRLAIGATRGDLTRQFMLESVVLSAAAALVGLIVAMWGMEAIVRFADIPVTMESAPDWRVGLFTIVVSLLSAVAFGLTPALRAAGLPLLPSLRSEPGHDARPRQSRLQRALIVGQLAASLVLLSSAGILLRGLTAAWKTEVGFTYDDRVSVTTDIRLLNYDRARARLFFDRALAGVAALPGVKHATLAHLVPFGGRVYVYRASLPGQSADVQGERVSVNRVWTGFFATMDIPILRGRDFTTVDLGGQSDAAVVSETMARRLWSNGDPIGQRFSIDGAGGPFHTVVGVARDVQVDEFTERSWSSVWLPHSAEAGEVVVLAASPRPPAQLLQEIEGVVRGIDKDLPVYLARPLRAYVAERLDGERALSKLLGICGALAIGLAALGLYSITAYGVAQRRREIGVRMALGASRSDVVGLFVREGLRLASRGTMWGILPAVAATYALSGMFVGVFPIDPVTLIGSILLLAAATLAAAYAPARRAAGLDPVIALRTE